MFDPKSPPIPISREQWSIPIVKAYKTVHSGCLEAILTAVQTARLLIDARAAFESRIKGAYLSVKLREVIDRPEKHYTGEVTVDDGVLHKLISGEAVALESMYPVIPTSPQGWQVVEDNISGFAKQTLIGNKTIEKAVRQLLVFRPLLLNCQMAVDSHAQKHKGQGHVVKDAQTALMEVMQWLQSDDIKQHNKGIDFAAAGEKMVYMSSKAEISSVRGREGNNKVIGDMRAAYLKRQAGQEVPKATPAVSVAPAASYGFGDTTFSHVNDGLCDEAANWQNLQQQQPANSGDFNSQAGDGTAGVADVHQEEYQQQQQQRANTGCQQQLSPNQGTMQQQDPDDYSLSHSHMQLLDAAMTA